MHKVFVLSWRIVLDGDTIIETKSRYYKEEKNRDEQKKKLQHAAQTLGVESMLWTEIKTVSLEP